MKAYALWPDGGTTRISAPSRAAIFKRADAIGATSVRVHPRKRTVDKTWGAITYEETERYAKQRGKWRPIAELGSVTPNPKRKGETLGDTIKRLRREGYPQRQAVAIAHREHGVARPRAARRRKNPSLVTYLANPGRGAQIASDVQAILYRHAKDGAYYVHVFGNQGDGDVMRSRGREYLRIDNLPVRTGVQLVGHGNVLTVRHRDGREIEREF